MIPVLAGRGRRSRNGELEASLGYMRSYLRKDKEGRKKKKKNTTGARQDGSAGEVACDQACDNYVQSLGTHMMEGEG